MLSPVKIWRNQKYISGLLGKRGKIITWTVIRVPPAGYAAYAPYPIVLVELADKRRVSCQLVDYSDGQLSTGQFVVLVVRKMLEVAGDGIIPYGIKAKPVSK